MQGGDYSQERLPLCVCASGRMNTVSVPAVLALADGTVFHGQSIGAKGNTTGEVVFNTAMTGYQEILTDPSYARQIVTLTCPHIGNTGTTPEDLESAQVYAGRSRHPRSGTAGEQLARQRFAAGVPRARPGGGDRRIDTRKLTRILREKGAQSGCIMTGEQVDRNAAVKARAQISGPEGHGPRQGRVRQEHLSVERGQRVPETGRAPIRANQRLHVVAYDYGIKRNILRVLADAAAG